MRYVGHLKGMLDLVKAVNAETKGELYCGGCERWLHEDDFARKGRCEDCESISQQAMNEQGWVEIRSRQVK